MRGEIWTKKMAAQGTCFEGIKYRGLPQNLPDLGGISGIKIIRFPAIVFNKGRVQTDLI